MFVNSLIFQPFEKSQFDQIYSLQVEDGYPETPQINKRSNYNVTTSLINFLYIRFFFNKKSYLNLLLSSSHTPNMLTFRCIHKPTCLYDRLHIN